MFFETDCTSQHLFPFSHCNEAKAVFLMCSDAIPSYVIVSTVHLQKVSRSAQADARVAHIGARFDIRKGFLSGAENGGGKHSIELVV